VGAGDPLAIRGILKAVGEDYLAIEQPENIAFVYPEDIIILNIRKDSHGRKQQHRPEIS
jgi:hypothetical protein